MLARWGAKWGRTLDLDDLNRLNDILRARLCHGLAFPPGVQLADAEIVFQVKA